MTSAVSENVLGAHKTPAGVDFGVYSETAERLWVCLFDGEDRETDRVEMVRGSADIWTASVDGLGEGARYGLRADGRYDRTQGYYFDPAKLLVDPYARRIDRRFVRRPQLCLARNEAVDTAPFVPKAVVHSPLEPVASHPNGEPPHLIYEVNVRPYTMRHPGVPGNLRGTVEALTAPAIIDHIKSLGVDVIELMPVAAWIDDGHLPALGLTNVWGYNPIAYFAPDPGLMPDGGASLRAMVSAYRREGIRVVLDVVYNHTGESDIDGPVVSMKGLDARTYYRHFERDGRLHLVNDAGTGNTLQCDHPAVQALVIDSLCHWVKSYGISGFRFDLATVLGRTGEGFSPDASLLERIRTDALLGQCLLIAEPWDTGPGGYQLGNFGAPFLEWNDRYRDDVRRFWKGDAHTIGALAGRLSGSSDQFGRDGRKPSASVNFLAAHDGFTLADLVAYSEKHNDANGEGNRDGHGENHSWNNGMEGPTGNAGIEASRKADVRALLTTLFVSRGTPMLTAGDELGRSQGGNNNAYPQDNDITWLDWDRADTDLIAYVARLSALRRASVPLGKQAFFTGGEIEGVKDVAWLRPDGSEMTEADWNQPDASVLGMFVREGKEGLLVWFNRLSQAVEVILPSPACFAVELVSRQDTLAVITAGRLHLPPRSTVLLKMLQQV